MKEQKHKILIADDSEMNRAIITDMLENEYEIIEAENGLEAVVILEKYGTEISLILLDIVMPELDGFGVLKIMNQRHWIEDIPVIMISSENKASSIEWAYDLGVSDFISRPFDAMIVHKRVINTILLYAKQKRLVSLVEEQIYEKEMQNNQMIDILSHVVEFRNGESGQHVVHVRTFTEMLLQHLVQTSDKYSFSQSEISIIGLASALHDIGKISIPAEILNKPGRLTDEEFAQMKTHSIIGARMLESVSIHQNEPLMRAAYEICRWHHERYDGRGYPDGLKGDAIPISAQIVSLADVYDALTSERCYKKAFSHETAIRMIMEGQCGTFNPLLLQCLNEISDQILQEMKGGSVPQVNRREIQNVVSELQRHKDLYNTSDRTLRLLEQERMKYKFLVSVSEDILFEYSVTPPMVTFSPWGAEKLGLPEILIDPMHDKRILSLLDQNDFQTLSDAIRSTTPENPVIQYECSLPIDGVPRAVRIVGRAIWSADDPPRYIGAIGRTIDIQEAQRKSRQLQYASSHDPLTGLLNLNYAKQRIIERLTDRPDGKFLLALFDLDAFRVANETYGHSLGNQLLSYIADRLLHCVRGGDITARVGGDEFLIFLEYKDTCRGFMERIFNSLSSVQFENIQISISMGIAEADVAGKDFETLFLAADQALYMAKQADFSQYCFYQPQDSSQAGPSTLSPILTPTTLDTPEND